MASLFSFVTKIQIFDHLSISTMTVPNGKALSNLFLNNKIHQESFFKSHFCGETLKQTGSNYTIFCSHIQNAHRREIAQRHYAATKASTNCFKSLQRPKMKIAIYGLWFASFCAYWLSNHILFVKIQCFVKALSTLL